KQLDDWHVQPNTLVPRISYPVMHLVARRIAETDHVPKPASRIRRTSRLHTRQHRPASRTVRVPATRNRDGRCDYFRSNTPCGHSLNASLGRYRSGHSPHRAAAKSSLRPPAHGYSAASCQVLSDPITVNRPQKQPQHPVLRPEQHESIDASTSRPRSSTSHQSSPQKRSASAPPNSGIPYPSTRHHHLRNATQTLG